MIDNNDVTIKTEPNSLNRLYQIIEVSIVELQFNKKVDVLLKTLITEAIKNIVRMKYIEIESMVIDEIFKKETRILVQNMIRQKLNEEIDLHIKEMFGKDNK